MFSKKEKQVNDAKYRRWNNACMTSSQSLRLNRHMIWSRRFCPEQQQGESPYTDDEVNEMRKLTDRTVMWTGQRRPKQRSDGLTVEVSLCDWIDKVSEVTNKCGLILLRWISGKSRWSLRNHQPRAMHAVCREWRQRWLTGPSWIFNEDIPMLGIPDTSVTELGIPQANGSHNEEARRSARACT